MCGRLHDLRVKASRTITQLQEQETGNCKLDRDDSVAGVGLFLGNDQSN